MYDYMRALEDRFTPEVGNTEQRQELEAKRQAVSALLDKQGRKSCFGWWMPTLRRRRKWH